MTDDALLTPEEVSNLIRVPVGTLGQWRYRGVGPRFLKLGGHVRYRPSDVAAWLEASATPA